MPWKAQTCPFCSKQYANHKGLQSHLVKYIGEWRYPADGVHDVSEIKSLSIMHLYFRDENAASREPLYKCSTCAKVVSGREKFIDHVFYSRHYNNDEEGATAKSLSSSSFDTEPYRVWQPQGNFPFLRLPLEIREMIYKAIFCFERIEVCNVQETYVHPDRGFWLQHNPPNNLLAIMATSQQVYYEARQIFYLYNTFIFYQKFAIPIFLIGIGRENALRFKSVEWRLGDDDQFENHIDIVKSCMSREGDQTQTQSEEEINCWNDKEQFVKMQRTIVVPYMLPYQFRDVHLRPLDADEGVPDDGFGRRYRFVFTARFHEHGGSMRHGKASYEMMKLRISRPHSD